MAGEEIYRKYRTVPKQVVKLGFYKLKERLLKSQKSSGVDENENF